MEGCCEVGRSDRLAPEALYRLGVNCEGLLQDFYGDRAVENYVVDTVNSSHPAPPDEGFQLVFT